MAAHGKLRRERGLQAEYEAQVKGERVPGAPGPIPCGDPEGRGGEPEASAAGPQRPPGRGVEEEAGAPCFLVPLRAQPPASPPSFLRPLASLPILGLLLLTQGAEKTLVARGKGGLERFVLAGVPWVGGWAQVREWG
jgi:hypothetical protein